MGIRTVLVATLASTLVYNFAAAIPVGGHRSDVLMGGIPTEPPVPCVGYPYGTRCIERRRRAAAEGAGIIHHGSAASPDAISSATQEGTGRFSSSENSVLPVLIRKQRKSPRENRKKKMEKRTTVPPEWELPLHEDGTYSYIYEPAAHSQEIVDKQQTDGDSVKLQSLDVDGADINILRKLTPAPISDHREGQDRLMALSSKTGDQSDRAGATSVENTKPIGAFREAVKSEIPPTSTVSKSGALLEVTTEFIPKLSGAVGAVEPSTTHLETGSHVPVHSSENLASSFPPTSNAPKNPSLAATQSDEEKVINGQNEKDNEDDEKKPTVAPQNERKQSDFDLTPVSEESTNVPPEPDAKDSTDGIVEALGTEDGSSTSVLPRRTDVSQPIVSKKPDLHDAAPSAEEGASAPPKDDVKDIVDDDIIVKAKGTEDGSSTSMLPRDPDESQPIVLKKPTASSAEKKPSVQHEHDEKDNVDDKNISVVISRPRDISSTTEHYTKRLLHEFIDHAEYRSENDQPAAEGHSSDGLETEGSSESGPAVAESVEPSLVALVQQSDLHIAAPTAKETPLVAPQPPSQPQVPGQPVKPPAKRLPQPLPQPSPQTQSPPASVQFNNPHARTQPWEPQVSTQPLSPAPQQWPQPLPQTKPQQPPVQLGSPQTRTQPWEPQVPTQPLSPAPQQLPQPLPQTQPQQPPVQLGSPQTRTQPQPLPLAQPQLPPVIQPGSPQAGTSSVYGSILPGRSNSGLESVRNPLVLSRWYDDVMQWSDAQDLQARVKTGRELPPQDYRGIRINYRVNGYSEPPPPPPPVPAPVPQPSSLLIPVVDATKQERPASAASVPVIIPAYQPPQQVLYHKQQAVFDDQTQIPVVIQASNVPVQTFPPYPGFYSSYPAPAQQHVATFHSAQSVANISSPYAYAASGPGLVYLPSGVQSSAPTIPAKQQFAPYNAYPQTHYTPVSVNSYSSPSFIQTNPGAQLQYQPSLGYSSSPYSSPGSWWTTYPGQMPPYSIRVYASQS